MRYYESLYIVNPNYEQERLDDVMKSVADKLNEMFKGDRKAFEEKWEDMKVIVEYGMLTEKKSFDKAEKFYRSAIVADPGHADAHNYLGVLLAEVRNDVDGAEKAYRAAIAANPGHGPAHCSK